MGIDNENIALIEANKHFYEAFETLKPIEMQKVWARASYVKCMHPGWRILTGYDQVMESWQMIFQGASQMKFHLKDVDAKIIGRIGIVTLFEELTSINYSSEVVYRTTVAATNIFEFFDDGWLMVHHQAGPTET